jgi:hypothetical protein
MIVSLLSQFVGCFKHITFTEMFEGCSYYRCTDLLHTPGAAARLLPLKSIATKSQDIQTQQGS